MFIAIRTLTYATLFVAVVLVFLPSRLLPPSSLVRPSEIGLAQAGGMLGVAAGTVVVLWCIGTFALVGKGTPAPFDPPRRLVVRGPYRAIRNPMYVGAMLALCGAALFYGSVPLLGYAVLFAVVAHGFVVWYEEPTLGRTFGKEYEDYCSRVGRWWPRA